MIERGEKPEKNTERNHPIGLRVFCEEIST